MLICYITYDRPLLAKNPEIYVHYMPWYQSKPFSQSWGYHWTMNTFNPETIKNKQREIASHHYPLIGPYDSNNPDVLTYHLQTIKLTGIDGLIIDWYGIEDYFDYAMIHRNTQHLIKHIKKAGLKFIICYEDQTYKHLLNSHQTKKEQALPSAIKTFQWMEQNWFNDSAYTKLNQDPVLLIFGPQYFKKDAWQKISASLKTPPKFFTLPHLRQDIDAQGCFTWPPVNGGKTIPDFNWKGDLEHVYHSDHPHFIPLVFPGYHDIYGETGKASFGYIDHKQGKTLKFTLDSAFKYAKNFIQIATWNDFGEGTVIEPTEEFGFQYLEMIQDKIKTMQAHKKIDKQNLSLPLQLYHLKQSLPNRLELLKEFNHLDDLLYQQNISKFKTTLKSIKKAQHFN
jgi:hypothetical protein